MALQQDEDTYEGEEYGRTDQEDELYEHYRFMADKGQDPLRIDKYLVNFVQNATRNKVQNAIRSGSVLVNGQAVKPNYKWCFLLRYARAR